jgi:hypothetical protein
VHALLGVAHLDLAIARSTLTAPLPVATLSRTPRGSSTVMDTVTWRCRSPSSQSRRRPSRHESSRCVEQISTSPPLDCCTSNATSRMSASPRGRFSARSSAVFPLAGRTSIGPLKFRIVNCRPAGIVPRQVYTDSSRPTSCAPATVECTAARARAE